tara:strand:- start:1816 stop:2703 length:888 start_codon:yes stop_codon:yes gene_type:complete
MRLRQLYEAEGKVASFALGRLNPATSGHELLVDAIKNAPGDSFLFLTDRAPKLPTDPLTSQEKLDWARKSFNGISIGLAKTVLTAADRLYKMGYKEVTFLEGEPKLLKILQQYNGVEKEMHNYNFTKINYVQLKRDPEAGDATGMSASKLRQTVLDNNIDSFKRGVTKQALPHADEMFKKLQGIMGVDAVEEDLEEFIKKKELVVQQQKPKIDVLNNIAMRSDNKPFPLSWNAGKGEISVGGKVFVDSSNAKKFVSFFDRNEDKQEAMLKALQSASTTAKLFDLLGLKYKLDMER